MKMITYKRENEITYILLNGNKTNYYIKNNVVFVGERRLMAMQSRDLLEKLVVKWLNNALNN